MEFLLSSADGSKSVICPKVGEYSIFSTSRLRGETTNYWYFTKGESFMARKHFAVAAAVSAAILLLSGCATGFDAATNNQPDSGNGRSVDVGALQIRNASVIVDPADTSRATIIMTVINNDKTTDDVLNGVAAAKTVGVDGEVNISLPHMQVVKVGYDSQYRIVLTSVSGALEPGQFVDVSLMFASGQSAPLSMLVNANTGIYADIEIPATAVAPAPAPSAS